MPTAMVYGFGNGANVTAVESPTPRTWSGFASVYLDVAYTRHQHRGSTTHAGMQPDRGTAPKYCAQRMRLCVCSTVSMRKHRRGCSIAGEGQRIYTCYACMFCGVGQLCSGDGSSSLGGRGGVPYRLCKRISRASSRKKTEGST